MNHILILSRQKKEELNRTREIQFREISADFEWMKYNINGSRTGSSKNIDLLEALEGTAEFSGATRFSNTFIDIQKSLLQMRETENYCNCYKTIYEKRKVSIQIIKNAERNRYKRTNKHWYSRPLSPFSRGLRRSTKWKPNVYFIK